MAFDLKTGDLVEVRRVERHGPDVVAVWVAATVIYTSAREVGVVFADHSRQVFEPRHVRRQRR